MWCQGFPRSCPGRFPGSIHTGCARGQAPVPAAMAAVLPPPRPGRGELATRVTRGVPMAGGVAVKHSLKGNLALLHVGRWTSSWGNPVLPLWKRAACPRCLTSNSGLIIKITDWGRNERHCTKNLRHSHPRLGYELPPPVFSLKWPKPAKASPPKNVVSHSCAQTASFSCNP